MAIKNCAYAGHIRSSKVRGIKSFLTKAQYLNIASRPCRYCGEISIRKGHGRDTSIALNSVDRRNNEGYYKITNSDPCCFVCQLMKRDIQADDFLKRIRKIALKATVT